MLTATLTSSIGRRMLVSRIVVVVVAAALIGTLGACSGASPTPQIVYVTPPSTASPTPGPTPTPAPTATPVPWTGYFHDAFCSGLREAPKIYLRYDQQIIGPTSSEQWGRVVSIVANAQSEIAALKVDLPDSREWPPSAKVLIGLWSVLTQWSLTLQLFDLMAQYGHFDSGGFNDAMSMGALAHKEYSKEVLADYRKLHDQFGFTCDGVPLR